jgi:hypothetical protein
MKKILPVLAVVILVLSGLGAVALPDVDLTDVCEIHDTLTFSIPTIGSIAEYTTVRIPETELTLQESGKPELPLFSYPIDLPFKSTNIQIQVIPSDKHILEVAAPVKPTPPPVEYTTTGEPVYKNCYEDPEVYDRNNQYPATWFDSKITCGMNSRGNMVTHISLYLFPVQYLPSENSLHYTDEMTISISYIAPEHPLTFTDEYDLVIIAPQKFSRPLQKLVDHKNDNGISTYLKTLEDIYDEYTGLDEPEQIKKFIYDAKETNNITYVLLVGGLKRYYNCDDRDDCNKGTEDWQLPVRYTNIKKTGLADFGALCDLYFADIYGIGGVFEDWDSNDDEIVAHWGKFPGTAIDELDLNPDVFVGRLPCRNRLEVAIMVRKITKYESTPPSSKDWMSTMVGISGLSHDFYGGQPDGEYLTDLAFTHMEDLVDTEVKVYASNNDTGGPIPVATDIVRAFSDGSGFLYFSGHGHPLRWDTHPLESTEVWMGGIHERDMWKFRNLRKLPIVVVGGCHNSQFNVTIYKTRNSPDLGEDHWYWTHGDPGPVCFSWALMLVPWGGAIATTGGTGLTSSLVGQPASGNGEIAINIFYKIGQEDAETFGEAFYGAIQKFIDENTIGLWESHCITIYNSFGDPSLQFGGIS